ncbi:MAG TPA: hypothetical protein VK828_02410 [Terriglobales bacterium]|nr:hypothetical protein [Terriglobales bacterium]
MADELGPAVTALQRKLDEQLQAVADTKRTINMLMKMSGKEALYPEDSGERSGAVRADQFYGRGLATAAAEYLAMRGQACQPDDIYRALVAGGFDFDLLGWQKEEQYRVRSLAMSLAKNTGTAGKFHRLKNGSFGLRSSYDPDFLRKAAEPAGKGKKKKSKSAKGNKVTKAPETVKANVADIAEKRQATADPAKVGKPKTSAKTPSRPEADQTAQKEVASTM